MYMTFTDRHIQPLLPLRRRMRGFTMVEMVVVIVVVGVLAAYVGPQLTSALSLRDEGWRDEVLSSMRYAHKSALAHRRLVCATVGSASVSLKIATVNPASSCGSTALVGPDGNTVFASSGASPGTAVSPASTLYFQPDGRVTYDGQGDDPRTFTITMSGASSITINGETGYAE
jgi:MSHA pilin protein MshC